jgi:hypothetical protein
MRERQDRQSQTLHGIALYLDQTEFTNKRVLHLKAEVLAHDARVRELTSENRAAKQNPSIRGRDVTKYALRKKTLLPLARRGRKLIPLYPGLELELQVPHKKASAAQIADAAERIADALTPHLNVLIKAKYPRNCLKLLREDARALRAHADAVVGARGQLGLSNRELTKELAAARDTINELDSVLRSLADWDSYKTAWTNWNRVSPRMGRPSKRRLAARERSAAKHGLRDD